MLRNFRSNEIAIEREKEKVRERERKRVAEKKLFLYYLNHNMKFYPACLIYKWTMVFARFLYVLVCEHVRGFILKFLRTFGISRFSPTKLSLFSSHVSFTHSDEASELFVVLQVPRCIISHSLI
jgi:hypothetical protein